MLMCNKLRIELDDGSRAVDYRIEEGRVERRVLLRTGEKNELIEKPWRRLTPDQISSHVKAGTTVARWLSRRMGIHRLVRACNEPSLTGSEANEQPTGSSTSH